MDLHHKGLRGASDTREGPGHYALTPFSYPYSPECVELAFLEVRRILGTPTCFVPWRTYILLAQEYAAFVT